MDGLGNGDAFDCVWSRCVNLGGFLCSEGLLMSLECIDSWWWLYATNMQGVEFWGCLRRLFSKGESQKALSWLSQWAFLTDCIYLHNVYYVTWWEIVNTFFNHLGNYWLLLWSISAPWLHPERKLRLWIYWGQGHWQQVANKIIESCMINSIRQEVVTGVCQHRLSLQWCLNLSCACFSPREMLTTKQF